MSFWHRILRGLGFSMPAQRVFYLDDELIRSLELLAEQEQRPPEQVAAELITAALSQRRAAQETLLCWYSLTPREQQVASLICQNYSTGEIAAALVIAPETVKTHVRSILNKFELHSRNELRLLLADWEFEV